MAKMAKSWKLHNRKGYAEFVSLALFNLEEVHRYKSDVNIIPLFNLFMLYTSLSNILVLSCVFTTLLGVS